MKPTSKAIHFGNIEVEDPKGEPTELALFQVTSGAGSCGVFAMDSSFLDQVGERESDDDDDGNLLIPNPFARTYTPDVMLLEYKESPSGEPVKAPLAEGIKSCEKVLATTDVSKHKDQTHRREGSLKLSYNWKCENFPQGIPNELWEALEETAQEQAFEMAKDGIREGQLLSYVNVNVPQVRTPENGFSCQGWFTISKEG